MKEKTYKQIRKKKLQIVLLSIILTAIGILIVNLLLLDEGRTDYTKVNNYLEEVARYYQDDSEVLKVVERCRNPEGRKGKIYYNTTTECVHYNIPFKWYDDKNREKTILSPSEMIKKEGMSLCRDISVFRMIVLKELGITSVFVFKPGHVYVVAFENGETYMLNNELIAKQ